MTRREMIEKVRSELAGSELSARQVAEVIDHVFDAIAYALEVEGKFTHPGFGTFTVKIQPSRPGRNPQTGEAIEIQGGATVGFKPAPELKSRVER